MSPLEYRILVEREFLEEVLRRPKVRIRFKDTDPQFIIAMGDVIAERLRTDEWEPTIPEIVDHLDPTKD